MVSLITLDLIQQAVALKPPVFDPRAAQLKMSPQPRPLQRLPDMGGEPRQAATLLLLYPIEERLHFVLTRRPESMASHAGQISLPGGRREPGEPFDQTAIRETCEEVNICEGIEIIGALTDLYIPPSDFLVYPFVGYLPLRPDLQVITSEVAEIIECPLDLLLDDSIKGRGTIQIREFTVDIMWYEINGYRVWGATAIMLAEMEARLRACL